MSRGVSLAIVFVCVVAASTVSAQWVEFNEETSTRLSVAAGLGEDDLEEKDYAFADVDKDGDIDLVIVRKEPFTSPGKRANVLLMNEGGVLVDRTLEFASDSDVAGDQGFLTPTNDRDVILVDVDGDTWLDIVTAVTISDGDPKHIGHPRIYMNLAEDGGGNWIGFRYEDARIPQLRSYTSQLGFNPRFCSIVAGDVDGDGFPDLFFSDYDSSGAGGFDQPEGADFNDRLLLNDGSGVFRDATQNRFQGTITVPGSGTPRFEVSAFGAAAAIEDMNDDDTLDIVKQTALQDPRYVGIAYNDPNNEGFFADYDVVNQASPYHLVVGDLNQDDLPDIVISDDGADRYLLNQGPDGNGIAQFSSLTFSFLGASDDGFGSDNYIVDLNNDTFNDVLIADADVDTPGCNRRLHIYRNLGGAPGSAVVLQEQTEGTGCATSSGNPASCLVAGIPSNMLEGVHDVAVFDIDGDSWMDMVLGRCTGTEVWINQPPFGLIFSYPLGLPGFVVPDTPTVFQVEIGGFGGVTLEPGTVQMFASVAGAGFNEVTLTDLGGNVFEATLPTAACARTIEFYFVAEASGGGGTFLDPPAGAAGAFSATAAIGQSTILEDDIEGDVSGWTVVNDPTLTTGAWEQAEPIGTLTGGGLPAAPDEDAQDAIDDVMAFVTENGLPGGASGTADVDGGPTDLISPPFNLSATDGVVTYSRWFFSSGGDEMTVWVTANGVDWVLAETVDGSNNAWAVSSFQVSDFVVPSATVQVRFRVSDEPNDSITEGGIDFFRVDAFVCLTCAIPDDCNDLTFCTGVEDCVGGFCVPGPDPCPGQLCDEMGATCADCLDNDDCDDDLFCNGAETCDSDGCAGGSDPCPGQLCDESNDVCADCLVDADCSDGLFCTGAETCIGGTCFNGLEPCEGQFCDDNADICVGTTTLQPKMGEPLLGLTAGQADRFVQGKLSFARTFTEAEGLGPIMNQNSCESCHNTPAGGSGSISVVRFGFNDDKGGGFDPLASLGGSLLQSQSLTVPCEESVPPEANVTANRVTPSTLGFGLIEAILDADIEANAITPPAGVSGRAHTVPVLENPPQTKIGRFGWKSQLATVLSFSGDASLNEMGITNRIVGTENAPNGDLVLLASCDTVADPEDGPDGQGFDFIDRVTDFQRFLAAPPQTPRSGMTGETHFNNVNCNSCHISSFTTEDSPAFEDAIRNKPLKPYTDFLLHDMGASADFIGQGQAGNAELRTPPLWGLRVRDPLWHDGRVVAGTFSDRMLAAINEHNTLNNEGEASAQAFNALTQVQKDQVVAFLDSLGRAEFDNDGDGDVDADDFALFQGCFTGPGSFYTADDACAVSDVDQDGDVDDDDFDLFLAASDGVAGSIAGSLQVSKFGGQLDLTWSASCLAADTDYGIYEGTIGGDFTSHVAVDCNTGGTNGMVTLPAGSTYYLVVPSNGFREGFYGLSQGVERAQGGLACLPVSAGVCQ